MLLLVIAGSASDALARNDEREAAMPAISVVARTDLSVLHIRFNLPQN
jgi:hypothetical protein